MTESLQSDTISFSPDEADEEELTEFNGWKEIEFLYEKQFIDSEGTIFPYSDEETDTTYKSCSHDFVSGTLAEHTKKSDGGCEIKKYHAQRCSKCGWLLREKWVGTSTFVVCPH